MPSAGTALPMLSREALIGGQLLYADEMSNEFPVQKLFGEWVKYTESNFVLDIVEAMRTLGTTWYGAPTVSDPVELEKFSRRVFKAFYKSIKHRFTSAEQAELRDILAMEPNLVPPSMQTTADRQAARIASTLKEMFFYLMRMYEKMCINAISSASYTVNVDGADLTISDWGITVNPVAVLWATQTTDVPADFALHLDAAETQFGGPVAAILMNSKFYGDYISKNDYFEPFIKVNPEWRSGSKNRLGIEYLADPASDMNYEIIRVRDQSGSAGSLSDMFPRTKLVFLGPKYKESLRNCTILSDDNAMNGGFYSYPIQEYDPIATTVVANIHAVPAVLDKNQVYVLDVATTP